MKKLAVVYWSGTGNTESMANAIIEGAKSTGAEAELFTPDTFDASMVSKYDVLAFGCPAMGDEVLEDAEFEPMFELCKSEISNKKIALFGSYGWGDGEWMRNWEDECTSNGAVLADESIICNEAPDDEALEKCKNLGVALVS